MITVYSRHSGVRYVEKVKKRFSVQSAYKVERHVDLSAARNIVFRKKEGNVLFNDAFNTFYLRLYCVRHMVKDHSDREKKPAVAT